MPNERGQNQLGDYERDFDDTVVQYFSHRLSESARTAFERWLHEEPARVQRVERLRAIWEASAETPPGPDAEQALGQVKERIRARRAAAVAERRATPLKLNLAMEPVGRARSWVATIWRVAAVVVMLAGAGLLWRGARPADSSLSWSAVRIYTTARGERASVNLPDGTIVVLHNESTLEVPAAFNGRTRDVRLRGEGYFEVAHDASRPFRVHGGGAVTRVLGTKFSVRARSEDGGVRVAVAEGRVTVGAGDTDPGVKAPVLTVGDVARLRGDGSLTIERGVDVGQLLSWTGGRLVYDHAPVPQVLADLSRWFDRDFVLGDASLARGNLTMELGGQSLAETVKLLEAALGARAMVDGRRIVLTRP